MKTADQESATPNNESSRRAATDTHTEWTLDQAPHAETREMPTPPASRTVLEARRSETELDGAAVDAVTTDLQRALV